MTEKLAPWLLYCHDCGLWTSRLGNDNNQLKQSTAIIEENRHLGLKNLRMQNFQKVLDALEHYSTLDGAILCDVGCSYGWFLETAAMRGMKVVGIEPEESVALVGIEQGFDIRVGYFPGCLSASDKFDVISFNDSLEHLSDIGQVLERCYHLLTPRGKLAINIPTSQGFFFRLGLLLYRFGYKTPLHRLWQKDYASPHLFYFNSENLNRCLARYGFKLLHSQSLKTVTFSGLWKRLRMDTNSSLLASIIVYCLLALSYPLLSLVPSDALLQIYEKQ